MIQVKKSTSASFQYMPEVTTLRIVFKTELKKPTEDTKVFEKENIITGRFVTHEKKQVASTNKTANATGQILLLLQGGKTTKEIISLGYNKSTTSQAKCLLKKYTPVFKAIRKGEAECNFSPAEIIYAKRFIEYIL